MSGITKKHMEDAAEWIRTGEFSLWRTTRERSVLVKFCVKFFKSWNAGFDETRFVEACNPSLVPKKGLKKSIEKYGRQAAKEKLEREVGISPPSGAEERKTERNRLRGAQMCQCGHPMKLHDRSIPGVESTEGHGPCTYMGIENRGDCTCPKFTWVSST